MFTNLNLLCSWPGLIIYQKLFLNRNKQAMDWVSEQETSVHSGKADDENSTRQKCFGVSIPLSENPGLCRVCFIGTLESQFFKPLRRTIIWFKKIT